MEIEWANQTQLHPLGIMALVLIGILTMALPRRYAALPIIVMACLIPSGQRIVLLGTDWTFVRIIVMVGGLRVLQRGEAKNLRLLRIDGYVIGLSLLILVASTIRTLSFDYLIRFVGVSIDHVGTYLLFRCWIRKWQDLDIVVRCLAALTVPIAVAFAYENATSRNIFSVFGGVPEHTLERFGKLRSQGPFSHPILAGCFWASLLPLFVAQFYQRRDGASWIWGSVGLGGASIIIVLAASSTPFVGVMAAAIGMAFYPLRAKMRIVRWAIVLALIGLQLVMNNPIWHLISRIDLVGGSTGWHRYFLIDNAVRHFFEWFLIGTNSTVHWGHGMQDITNEYLAQGMRGGFGATCLLIAVLVQGYKSVGRLWRVNRRDPGRLMLAWALGACLFAHTVQFIAVSYFGQIILIWAFLLATIASLQQGSARPKRARAKRPEGGAHRTPALRREAAAARV